MRRNIHILLLIAAGLFLLTGSVSALVDSDRIILRDGTMIEGRIIEVTPDRIDYLPVQGPIFGSVPIERVSRIEYGDGRVSTLAPLEEQTPAPPPIVPRGYIPTQPKHEERGIRVNIPLLAVSWAAIGLGTWQGIHGYNVHHDLLDEEARLKAAGLPVKSNKPAFEASKYYAAATLACFVSVNAFFLAIRPEREKHPFPVTVTPRDEGVKLAANIEF
jgi:hypothetical protein